MKNEWDQGALPFLRVTFKGCQSYFLEVCDISKKPTLFSGVRPIQVDDLEK